MAERENVFFYGVDAVYSPGILRQPLSELDFYHAVRFESADIFRDELAVVVPGVRGSAMRVAGPLAQRTR